MIWSAGRAAILIGTARAVCCAALGGGAILRGADAASILGRGQAVPRHCAEIALSAVGLTTRATFAADGAAMAIGGTFFDDGAIGIADRLTAFIDDGTASEA